MRKNHFRYGDIYRNSKENAQTVDIGEIHLVPLPEARDTRNPSNVFLMAEEKKFTESIKIPINIFILMCRNPLWKPYRRNLWLNCNYKKYSAGKLVQN